MGKVAIASRIIKNELEGGYRSNSFRYYILFDTAEDEILRENIVNYFQTSKVLPESFLEYYKTFNKRNAENLEKEEWSLVVLEPEIMELSDSFPKEYTLHQTGGEEDRGILITIPYDSNNLNEFYQMVNSPLIKSAHKTAAALLKQTRGNIEAAAQLMAKTHNF